MKLFGHGKNDDDSAAFELSEVSFAGDADSLRAIAQFLRQSADLMDRHGSQFGHEHLSDANSGWSRDYPDVIVAFPIE